MSLQLWCSLLLVCALGAISPGPSLAMVMRHTLGSGRACGVAAALAHAVGVGLYAGLTVVGLAAVIVHQPWLYRLIAWGGALYLAWLGIQALRAGAAPAFPVQDQQGDWRRAVRDGLLVALGNPKLIVFFVALLSQFVEADMGAASRWLIVATAAVVDGGWYLLVAMALSQSHVLPWLRHRAVWVHRLTGGILIALALRVALG
ncbi:LysE family translocator [Salinicola rhizosphaerae]|uniref:Amino acid efflux permease RhtB family protein n=1 Tax=Salinicola rhizosphaerae TaxID=1443141 RepID=A0ABQ3E108_9GAMM|nr:LysE family transporter [Salinicola rhizosphaerae]GHB22807.1 amino acid efflux permease RhtB family protein [Salinicola rhizosphaerae]